MEKKYEWNVHIETSNDRKNFEYKNNNKKKNEISTNFMLL